MQTIQKDRDIQTVITTFEMSPGTCQDLLDALMNQWLETNTKALVDAAARPDERGKRRL